MKHKTSIYFVASPLHYLAALQIKKQYDNCDRKILVFYRSNIKKIIQADGWDNIVYAPWPRFEPLPGFFGKHFRLLDNIKKVAKIIGHTDEINLHSPVFDTEAINYYLRSLPKLCKCTVLHARIIPDGVMNLSRHPLASYKLLAQCIKKLRRLTSPLLDYWCFTGDRIGSDASFVDRIYTLPGFPSPYSAQKTVQLDSLNTFSPKKLDSSQTEMAVQKALIVGQPLSSIGALSHEQVQKITKMMDDWLRDECIQAVYYKPHPRDPQHEFQVAGSSVLDISIPLEQHIAHTSYAAIIGVDSTTLLLAKAMLGKDAPVHSFGMNLLRNAHTSAICHLRSVMQAAGIKLHDCPDH